MGRLQISQRWRLGAWPNNVWPTSVRGVLIWVLTGAVLAWLCLIGIGLLFTNPHPVSTATLETELLSVQVLDPRKSAFNIAGARLGPLGEPQTGECATGLFTPARGATVTFGRVALGPLEITVDPAAGSGAQPALVGTFQTADQASARPVRGATAIVVDKACNPPESQRFPIWGHVEIGREFRPATGVDAPEPFFLLGGAIQIAAHSIYTRTLYQVASVTVPVGGRLQSTKSGMQSESAIW